MKIDLTQSLLYPDGKKIGLDKECFILEADKITLAKDEKGNFETLTIEDKENELTLKRVLIRSLISDFPLIPGGTLSGDEKAERGGFFFRISQSNGEIDLTMADAVKIQKVVQACEGTLIGYQACKMLEKKDEKTK